MGQKERENGVKWLIRRQCMVLFERGNGFFFAIQSSKVFMVIYFFYFYGS